MDRRHDDRRERRVDLFTALLRDPERFAQDRLRCCGAETHDRFRSDQRELAVEPGATRSDLARARLLMDATFAFQLPLEVFHCVGHVDAVAIDPGRRERLVQLAPRWTDEWYA